MIYFYGWQATLPFRFLALRKQIDLAGQTAPFGTDASILQTIAPCVVLGPGDIDVAHKPGEAVRIADLTAAVPVFQALALRLGC